MLAALAVVAGPAMAQPAPPDPVVTAAQGYQLRLLGGLRRLRCWLRRLQRLKR